MHEVAPLAAVSGSTAAHAAHAQHELVVHVYENVGYASAVPAAGPTAAPAAYGVPEFCTATLSGFTGTKPESFGPTPYGAETPRPASHAPVLHGAPMPP